MTRLLFVLFLVTRLVAADRHPLAIQEYVALNATFFALSTEKKGAVLPVLMGFCSGVESAF
jgi:hypothetical protein